MMDDTDHAVMICMTCSGQEEARKLRQKISDRLPDGFRIRPVDCLAGCDHPIAIGFQAHGKASYLFGNIENDADCNGIVEFAAQFKQSKTGWTNSTERPEALADKTIARLPALRTQNA